ncbi:DegT/DnrJ/EryC1/StrS family aminotransferase [Limimaricola cinnabarinus]|uniref:Aminotransferase n=1 Tax=Limimaricola cinnabarinus TaxID=1125964 RepID=A0A2G1MED3_9RHOB|nr:aminotransferase class I/II-fold pyridoxal phosphate-dependent enzyme [Limimaricola cinnabarinus]PHP27057.1 aminotransferase [Limimaricola cinnabarinus]
MAETRFTGSFTQQEPIPEEGISAALELLRTGRLHRYNTMPGETSLAARLEAAYAAWQGARYCLALASGGQAMQIALRACGVRPGDKVLSNAFTLAPVPGAVAAVGAETVLVEITEDLVIDLDDLAVKARASGARHLLLSNMRGHLCDMDRLMRVAEGCGLTVIEDCAHTMGAKWNGRRSGNFGAMGCFSTQTYKHMNSGEGGFLTTDDPELMARAIIMSGSYMLYERHGAAPPPEVFERIRLETPNMSARMDNLRAAILLPQLDRLDDAIARWNALHDRMAERLAALPGVALPERPAPEFHVGSSIQFRLPGLGAEGARQLLSETAARGVELKWFGADEPMGFTSNHASWRYLRAQSLPRTDAILAELFDMRLPLTFAPSDCDAIAQHLGAALAALRSPEGAA